MLTRRELPSDLQAALARSLTLTRAGLWVERGARAFWPLATLVCLLIAAVSFGLDEGAPLWARGAALAALLVALGWGLWRLRPPTEAEALARIDATLPGRPLSALADRQALGAEDAGSRALWAAHQARMADRARAARAVGPHPDLAPRDPYALRLVGVTALVMALLFGAPERLIGRSPQPGAAGSVPVAAAASWEGWIEPPPYTRRPSLYLGSLDAPEIILPQGSKITIRIYGDLSAVTVDQTVADPPPPAEAGTLSVVATRSGRLSIAGPGGRDWAITVQPDAPPQVALAGAMERAGDGTLRQGYTATDDHAVTRGEARITLDLPAADRRHGLTTDPDPRPDLVLDLPLPVAGKRDAITGTLIEDASQHPWANLPVRLTLTVRDGAGQTGSSAIAQVLLPGRRFFDPMAAALIEQRRDLLWARANGPRVAQILRAVTHRPEGLFRDEASYLALRVAMRRLDAALAAGPLTTAVQDEIATALWDIAVQIEDGGLSDALARMQRAQDQLSQAIRNGASPEEIDRLMQELAEATRDYVRQLAEQNRGEQGPKFTEGEAQQITGDQIQQMMDEIERLMKEGRMAEAQALLEQFNQMMQNLQVTQGQGGEGMPGGQAMQGLQDTLRGQQGLSDEAFRNLQDELTPGGSNRERQEQGQAGEGSLADRQRALREALEAQRRTLPGTEGPAGETARQRLDEAGRAMEQAEEALRQGDTGTALDRQAEAIERLRDGIRNLGDALAGNRPQDGQDRAPGGDPRAELPRDPLGRSAGSGGQISTDDPLGAGQDAWRRAQDLLDEIRRRAGERTRPESERNYLDRLLDRFDQP